MNERALQDAVIELARLLGWRVAHFRPAKTEKGWRTPVEADGRGFPDLVMVRSERLIVAELKAVRGRLAPEQDAWLDAFRFVGASVAVWLPRDWLSGEIERALR